MPTGHYVHRQSSAAELFNARVQRSEGCWPWHGSINRGGYGVLTLGGREGKKVYAHRLSYELHVGPIPEGLELDHLCRNRRCVRPDHLEAVTRRTNTIRGVGPALLARLNGSKTHCANGHPFDEENTRHRKGGGRTCLICERLRRMVRTP